MTHYAAFHLGSSLFVKVPFKGFPDYKGLIMNGSGGLKHVTFNSDNNTMNIYYVCIAKNEQCQPLSLWHEIIIA